MFNRDVLNNFKPGCLIIIETVRLLLTYLCISYRVMRVLLENDVLEVKKHPFFRKAQNLQMSTSSDLSKLRSLFYIRQD